MQRLGRAALAVGDAQRRELSPGQRVLGGREHPAPGQLGEHALAAADGAVAACRRERVHPRRRLRQRREEGDLGPGEVLDRLVEVAARGVGDAVDAVAVRDDAQVMAQHLARAVALGEEDGGDRLGHLAQVAARARALHARHLHGERRRPRDPAARPQVLQQRPRHCERIDAGVGAEAAVLERQGRRDHARRQRRDRPVPEPFLSHAAARGAGGTAGPGGAPGAPGDPRGEEMGGRAPCPRRRPPGQLAQEAALAVEQQQARRRHGEVGPHGGKADHGQRQQGAGHAHGSERPEQRPQRPAGGRPRTASRPASGGPHHLGSHGRDAQSLPAPAQPPTRQTQPGPHRSVPGTRR